MYASVRCHDRVFLRLRGAEMGGKPVEDFEYEEMRTAGSPSQDISARKPKW